MIPGDYTLTIWRGIGGTWMGQVCKDLAGTDPQPLTGCTISAGIRPPSGADPLIPLTGSVPDSEDFPAAQGYFQVAISDENAELLTGTYYSWTCVINDSLGKAHPVLKGKVIVITPDL